MSAEQTPAKFPKATSPYWTEDEAAASAQLVRIDAWRNEWDAWLGTQPSAEHISPPLRDVLSQALGKTRFGTAKQLPYRLQPFPAEEGYPSAEARLEAVLLWRAGLVDFLADVWDTLGPSTYDMDECSWVSSRLTPEGAEKETCPICLSPLPRDKAREHYSQCPVQARWKAP